MEKVKTLVSFFMFYEVFLKVIVTNTAAGALQQAAEPTGTASIWDGFSTISESEPYLLDAYLGKKACLVLTNKRLPG